jgi:hypothetical protein
LSPNRICEYQLPKRSSSTNSRFSTSSRKKVIVKRPKTRRSINLAQGVNNAVSGLAGLAANRLIPGAGAPAAALTSVALPAVARLAANGFKHTRDFISRLVGSGDYTVVNDAKRNALMGDQVPHVNSNKRVVNFSHREFAGYVYSAPTSGGTTVVQYDINPMNMQLFPIGCAYAQTNEYYNYTGLVAEFKSTSSDFSGTSSSALGSVGMAFNPDPIAAAPTSIHTLLQRDGAVSTKPSQSVLMGIECDPGLRNVKMMQVNPNYDYSGSAITTSGMYNQALTSWGSLIISVSGVPSANIVLGELWISYSIEFSQTKFDQGACIYELEVFGGKTAATDPAWFYGSLGSAHDSFGGTVLTPQTITLPRMTGSTGAFLLIEYLVLAQSSTPLNMTANGGFVLGSGFEAFTSGLSASGALYTINEPVVTTPSLCGIRSVLVAVKDSGDLTISMNNFNISASVNTRLSVRQLNRPLLQKH